MREKLGERVCELWGGGCYEMCERVAVRERVGENVGEMVSESVCTRICECMCDVPVWLIEWLPIDHPPPHACPQTMMMGVVAMLDERVRLSLFQSEDNENSYHQNR